MEEWEIPNEDDDFESRYADELDLLDEFDKEEIAEHSNLYFSSITDNLRSGLGNTPSDFSKLVNFVESCKDPDMDFSVPDITNAQVLQIIKGISPHKAAGIDKISARFLHIAALILAPSIARLINMSFSTGTFPTRWKTANVTPLFKQGAASDPSNYRPISVLPVVSKVIERHMHNSLYAFLMDNNFYSRQSGFGGMHSTETALIKLVDELLFGLDNNHVCGMVLVDYQKAFDMVDQKLLLCKLELYGIVNRELAWCHSYLSDRKQIVRVNGSESSEALMLHGVPQGSILGPLFFILFINDLPLYTSAQLDLYAYSTTVNTFADVKNLANLSSSLNKPVSEIQLWALANKLPLNEDKTKVLTITGKRCVADINGIDIVVTVNGKQLNDVDCATLLGEEIDSKLSFNEHIEKVCKKMASRIAILHVAPSSKKGLNFLDVKEAVNNGVELDSVSIIKLNEQPNSKKRNCDEMFLPLLEDDVEDEPYPLDAAPCKKKARLSPGKNGASCDADYHLLSPSMRSPLRQLQPSSNQSQTVTSIDRRLNEIPSTKPERRKVFRRPPMSCESVPITRTDGQRLYLSIRHDREEKSGGLESKELIDYANPLKVTKRSLLKLSAKVSDPLGLLSPFTITRKCKSRSLCLEKLDWDIELQGRHQRLWKNFVSSLIQLNNVRVPRCYFNSSMVSTDIQIHSFSDASKRAYAAAFYLRSEYEDGHVEVKLLSSKTRVTPIKQHTVPRLEVLGSTSKPAKELSASEINDAETYWIKTVQASNFDAKIKFLTKNSRMARLPRVKQFGLYKDSRGVYRCKGRLNNSDLPATSKNPTLLPSKNDFVSLLIKDGYANVKPNGVRDTLTTLRENYWMLHAQEATKSALLVENLKAMLRAKAKTRRLNSGCSGVLRTPTPQVCRAGGIGPRRLVTTRLEDESLSADGCFWWLTEWKNCPSHTIAGLVELYEQLLPTRVYTSQKTHTSGEGEVRCRLCGKAPESVAHILSGCSALAQSKYLSRHDAALKVLFYQLLYDEGFIDEIPPWYSPDKPKPVYESENVKAYWDVPIYADQQEVRCNRVDARIVNHMCKRVVTLEMSCPLVNNRTRKDEEKTLKYEPLRWELRQQFPGYEVKQYNIIMDALGGEGWSRELDVMMRELVGGRSTDVLRQMQRAVLSGTLNIARTFKVAV
ncbi:RNA-directed DNA polymerase from mobile element jockey [Stylophora pistillata]|uniref:RNA-directed DNA polymerase from mobile element jockey n=1 Tax=Stylophora pistillata TaxID=50429 RepID=A0A2B4RGV5_STYPI|nr:RNA-directed DNA polymerase from mobile element jockey [Stylophora pistillata]